MALALLSLIFAGDLFGFWWFEFTRHTSKLRTIPIRFHVNGIRGKSTVTRLIAGAFREAGLKTVAKTTGSAAVVIDQNGIDHPIRRNGAPSLLEQIDIIRSAAPEDAQAVVIECMAIRPEYQAASEDQMIKSTIGVITNVREDHMDELGKSLVEIGTSLASTCPVNGHLITAERNNEVTVVLDQRARERGSTFQVADASKLLTDEDMRAFGAFHFAENVALALAVCEHLGIARDVALAGMRKAPDDPGAMQARSMSVSGRTLHWVNLLAVNDRESAIIAFEKACRWCCPNVARIALINNRTDRESRALQFADIASRDLAVDRIALLGAYAKAVTLHLTENGVPRERIVAMGEERKLDADSMLGEILNATDAKEILLVGLGNIHTEQAEALLAHFETLTPAEARMEPAAARRRAPRVKSKARLKEVAA